MSWKERTLFQPSTIILGFICCFLMGEICYGTLVGKEESICPVCDHEITVMTVGSYGSYIYETDSKYDLIYFPYDGPKLNFIYLCPHCGYAQVSKDFFNLKGKEKTALKKMLSKKWSTISPEEITPEIRLNQAILVNKFLEKDEDFWVWFYRVLIYHYRKSDPEKAKKFVRAELELLQKGKGVFEEPEKNRNYLLGEYHRMLGNDDLARKHLSQAYKVDVISPVKKGIICIILLELILFFLLFYIWTRARVSKILKILYTLFFIIIIVIFSIGMYFTPNLVQRKEQLRSYYDKIITDRINLLYEQPEKQQSQITTPKQTKEP